MSIDEFVEALIGGGVGGLTAVLLWKAGISIVPSILLGTAAGVGAEMLYRRMRG